MIDLRECPDGSGWWAIQMSIRDPFLLPSLEIEEESRLEELRRAPQIEAIEISVAIGEKDVNELVHMPDDHRRHTPELAALEASVIEIAVGQVDDRLERSATSLEYGLRG